jgi:hypothetical protein
MDYRFITKDNDDDNPEGLFAQDRPFNQIP